MPSNAGDARAIKAILQYQVDAASQTAILKSIADVEARMRSMNANAAQGAAAASDAAKSVAANAGAAASGVGDLQGAVASASAAPLPFDNVRTGLKGIKDDADAAKVAVRDVSSGTGGGGVLDVLSDSRNNPLTKVGQQVRLLPSMPIPGTGIGTDSIGSLLRLAGVIDTVAAGFGGVLAVAAPLAVAGGAVALALSQQRDAEEKLKAAAEATIDAIQREADAKQLAAGAAATGDVGKAKQQEAELTAQRDAFLNNVYQPRIEAMQKRSNELLLQAQATAQKNLNELIDPKNWLAMPEADRNKLLQQETDKVYNDLLNSDTGLKALANPEGGQSLKQLTDQVTTFNDEINKLSDIGVKGATTLEALNRPLEDQIKLRELEGKSSKQLAAERSAEADDLATLNTRIVKTEAEINQARAAGDNTLADVLTQQNVKNRADYDELQHTRDLTSAALKVVQGREAETASMARFTDILKGLLKGTSDVAGAVLKGYNDLAKANQSYEEGERDHSDKLADIYANRADAEDKAWRSQQESLDDLSRKTEKDRLNAQEKADEDREKLDEDHQAKLAKIERDYNNARENAIATRDAAALEAADVQRKQQTDDENDSYKSRQKDIQKALDKQNKQIDDNLAEQERVIRRRYKDQLDDAQTAAVKAIDLENRRWSYQEAKLKEQIGIAEAAWEKMGGAARGFGDAADAAAAKLNKAANSLAAAVKAVPGGLGNAVGSGLFHASGGVAYGPSVVNEQGIESGRNLRTGRFMVFNDPTQIYTAAQTQTMMGGMQIVRQYNLTLNREGVEMKQVRTESERIALKHIRDFVRAS